jgi:phage terminase large subunit-like protein
MSLPELEAEMTGWNPDSGERSPNRLDAMVFGITKCMKGGLKEARMWGAT